MARRTGFRHRCLVPPPGRIVVDRGTGTPLGCAGRETRAPCPTRRSFRNVSVNLRDVKLLNRFVRRARQ
jgi:hypothetical protein